MLLETLNALDQAAALALRSACGLDVVGRDVSLVREGHPGFLTLGTLRLKGCPLQMIHLGCDEQLSGQLEGKGPGAVRGPGLSRLAESFLEHLLAGFDGRHPRGSVENHRESPANLHTRGLRTFQFRLDTGRGVLYFLAEVPSRTEMAIAKGSDFLTSMESIYLPADWSGRDELPDTEAVDSFLTFLRKTEGDVYLETPEDEETNTVNAGLLVETGEFQGRPFLKFITDYLPQETGAPEPGASVKASVGVGDRSLEFDLQYLAPATHELAAGTRLPCALFSLPRTVSVGQRRRLFRVSVSVPVRVEIEGAVGQGEWSPWSDGTVAPETISGHLADLSFSGARIKAETDHGPCFQKDSRVVCRMYFPELEEPVVVQSVIRRATAVPADRNGWRDDIGVEFIVAPGGDRAGLDFVRQFVLQVQRSRLAQRLQVTGS